MPSVRYIEPTNTGIEEIIYDKHFGRSGARVAGSCVQAYSTPFTSQGYNSRVSWHLYEHNVPAAWAYSIGSGIKIGMVDTGLSEVQGLLQAPLFNSGLSSGRTIENHENGIADIDIESHGTGTTSVAAGPVNNVGSMTGVAYGSSIKSVKAGISPWFYDNIKFASALNFLANDNSVKIINISMGRLLDYYMVRDAVDYAVNKGKLVICAAGSVGGMAIYPAKYGNTIGATGVAYDASDPNGTNLNIYGENASGSHVDFAVYTYRLSDGAEVLKLGASSYTPECGHLSSQAAATLSGIAALVWSARPELTAQQVHVILTESGSYGTRSFAVGHGIVDAEEAVLAAMALDCSDFTAYISGPGQVPVNNWYSWSASVTDPILCGAASYSWSAKINGGQRYETGYGENFEMYVQSTDDLIELTVTATRDGGTDTAEFYVRAYNPYQ